MTQEFVEFLVEAKRGTYAAQGDDASVRPALPGSKQLEYQRGLYVYRDVYFGMRRFVGQETVYHAGRPMWSMAYAGGLDRSDADSEQIKAVYAFLREAMRLVSAERPYRGPASYRGARYMYACVSVGDLEAFRGTEEIQDSSGLVYRLRFAGGRVDE